MASRFSKQAHLYARYRPDYPRELFDFIYSHLFGRETAWDCATGSGQVAAVLADQFDKVYASDISTELLKYAIRKPNIKYVEAPAEKSGFSSGIFDLITVAQAIHWFDFESFYAEARRTAKEHALLAAIGYGFMEIEPEIDKITHRFYGEMFGRYFGSCRNYLDERYANIPFPFDEIPSPDFLGQMEWSFEDFEGFLNTWSPVQRYKDEHGSNPVEPLLDELSRHWGPGESRTVAFPVFMRLGRVQ